MAQEQQREEFLIRDRVTGQPRPYYVAADNINLGDDENYQSLTDTLKEMQDDIDAASGGGGGECTVTAVKMNNCTPIEPDENGVVNLGTVITQHQDVSNKVDKVTGKGLSTNDYTTAEKAKLAGLSNYNDTQIQAAIDALQSAIDALTGVNDTTEVINTMNEVVNFLAGVTNDETLTGKLNELRTLINGKVDKETGKSLMTAAEHTKLENLPTNPVQSVTINGSTPAVGDNGNVNLGTIVGQQGPQGPKGDRGDLNISEGATPTLSIISDMNTPDDEQDNIKVLSSGVGYNLGRAMLTAMELPTSPDTPIAGCTYYDPTASINARIKMYYIENNTLKHIDTAPSEQMMYCDMSSNTTYRFDGLEMVQVGGGGGDISYTEDSTTIYVTSAGHVDPTPRISVSPTEISLSPVVGGTMTKTIIVRGYNLSQGITIALTDASGFYSLNTQSLPAGGGNIVLTYHPTSAGTHNASLNISSGDASAAVSIVGVAASPTINVSSQSISMRGASGSVVTASFRVTGVSLADDINVAVSGSGFSASPIVITAQQAVDGVDVAVTFDGSASTGSGTITLSSTGATSVQVAVTYEAIERLQEGDTITSYVGMVFTVLSDRQSVSVKGSSASGAIVIPSVVQDSNGLAYDVTVLDLDAFRQMPITSVEIPASVTSWKTDSNGYSRAFYRCTSLTSAIIRSQCVIGHTGFSGCTSLRSVQIDDGVTEIGGSAFSNCPFESLVIPDSVTSSGAGAFGDCGLKYLQIGTSTACAFRLLNNSLYNGTAGAMSLQYIVLYSTSIPTANLGAQKRYGASLPPHYRNYDSTNEAKGTNYDTNGTGRLYVPNSVLNAYRTNAKDYTGAADIDKSRNIFKDLNDINDSTGASGRIWAIEDIGTISGYENDALLTD